MRRSILVALLCWAGRLALGLRLGLVLPTLPWTFGPYQSQGMKLAQVLHTRHQMEVYVIPINENLPQGPKHRSPDQVAALVGCEKPPPNWKQAVHVAGYIGIDWGGPLKRVSLLNQAAGEHGLEALVTLMDLNMLLRDEDFGPPALAWYPYHFATLNHVDAFALRGYAGVASLAPSSARILERRLGRLPVRVIPHTIEPDLLAGNKLKLDRAELGLPEGAFMVLLQGGNYQVDDRKGWVVAIQAFQQMHAARPDSHLYIHAITERAILRKHRQGEPPQQVKNSGVPLLLLLDQLGLPSEAYTLVTAVLRSERVAALKELADVCLHPSKTEGFGMNVLECQVML